MRERKGDLSKVFFFYAEWFCALDVNVIRARYWNTKWPLPEKAEEHEDVLVK